MARKRIGLYGGAAAFAVYMAYILITALTPWLDGEVGGVGVAYIAGFVVVAGAFAATCWYAAWGNRREDAARREG